MAVVSNQYSTRVFSEHPTALWPLDDEAYFISLIDNDDRDMTLWNLTNCNVSSSPSIPDEPSPFNDNNYYEIIGDHTQVSGYETILTLRSNALFSFNSLNQDLKNICINFYLYQDSVFTNYYQFGFRYFDDLTSSYKEVLTTVDSSPFSRWLRLNDTFDISEFDSDSCELIIKISVTEGGGDGDYNFIVNGLSVAQWSESSSAISLGSSPELISEDAQLPGQYGIPAKQYGFLNNDAYYLVEDNKLLARNEGVPMVFGAQNSTKIIASGSGLPSLVFPALGLFSNKGQYKASTLEFWLRIKPNTKNEFRILGPLFSEDGLYVSEGFLTLVAGDNVKSYYVSKWYRPMLVHISYSPENISVLINSEKVIDIPINSVPDSFLLNSEWMGFYSNDSIEIFEVDSICIMPYIIPLPVAKRRLVWGQGVESQQIIDSSFKGESVSISSSNSKYSANIVYPDKERWDAAYYNNFVATTSSLSLPQYSVPVPFLSNRTLDLWYQSNKVVNEIEDSTLSDIFFTFRPGVNSLQTEWDRTGPDWNEKAYLPFSSTNISFAPVSAIYAIFEIMESVSLSRPLIHIINSSNEKRFEINVNQLQVKYIFDGIEIFSQNISIGEKFVVGIHIPTLIQQLGYPVADFFSSYELLNIYVGGAPNTPSQSYETFEGKIYRVSFADQKTYQKISDHFGSNGIAEFDSSVALASHFSTYTASPFIEYEKFFFDISIDSYWEEYYPLSFFAKNISSSSNTYYGFDYIQFNVDYPSIVNYEISGDSQKDVVLNLEESPLQMFATFQLLSEGADEPLESFVYDKKLDYSRVIDAPLENTSLSPYKAFLTKFDIMDQTIIYPPKNIDIGDVAIVLHFVLHQQRILTRQLKIKNMSLSSRALNINSANPIGTKFGTDAYPYVKNGIYFNYKEKNPVFVGTENNPYLYLTETSGIKTITESQENKEYGVIIPINQAKSPSYSIAAAQFFIKLDMIDELSLSHPIFEINHDNGIIEFILEKDSSGLRNILKTRDKLTKEEYTNISLYQNGIDVNKPFIIKNEWNSIGFVFPVPITFNSFSGSINIFSKLLVNNFSIYSPQGLNQFGSVDIRSWQKVLTQDNVNNLNWQYWYDENGSSDIKTWRQVYVISEQDDYYINPSNIFEAYVGTNIDSIDDDEGISVFNDDFYIYSGVIWSSIVDKPV